jgi:CRP-like cAMP-binding protein
VTVGGRSLGWHFAGDLLGLQQLVLPRADHYAVAVTEARFAWISTRDLTSLLERYPKVNGALWREAMIAALISREWLLRGGRSDAKTKVAHLLCELAARQEAAAMGTATGTGRPITQEQIADATGLTPVHVNRTLRALAEDGAVATTRRLVLINDWPALCRAGEFDPAYLHGDCHAEKPNSYARLDLSHIPAVA